MHLATLLIPKPRSYIYKMSSKNARTLVGESNTEAKEF